MWKDIMWHDLEIIPLRLDPRNKNKKPSTMCSQNIAYWLTKSTEFLSKIKKGFLIIVSNLINLGKRKTEQKVTKPAYNKKKIQNIHIKTLTKQHKIYHHYTVKLQMTNIKKRSYSNKDKNWTKLKENLRLLPEAS